MNAWGLAPHKKLGQNFLADPGFAAMLVEKGAPSPTDVVLEVGAGLGALTWPLSKIVRHVHALEKDQGVARLLRTELLADRISNVAVICGDILVFDIRKLAEEEDQNLVVFGNLPYNISSQVIIRMIQHRRWVKRCVFMLQKELAQRIAARPGSKTYGRLSAMLAFCSEIKPLATVGAHLFYPRPKVDSQVVEIRFLADEHLPKVDEEHLFQVIKAAFSKRRKTLRNALTGFSPALTGHLTSQWLESAGIEQSRRAETLSVEEFVALANAYEKTGES